MINSPTWVTKVGLKPQCSILDSNDKSRLKFFLHQIVSEYNTSITLFFSLQSIDFELQDEDSFEEEISSMDETDMEEDEILLSESSDNQSFLLDENNQSHGS